MFGENCPLLDFLWGATISTGSLFLDSHVQSTPKVLIYLVATSISPLNPTFWGGDVNCITLTPHASRNLVGLGRSKQDITRELLKG